MGKQKRIEDELCYAVTDALYKLEAVGWLTFAKYHPEGRRSPQYGLKMKRMGVRAGFPDYWIGLSNGKTVFIELKKATGTLSPAQKIWHAIVDLLGYAVFVVKTDSPNEAVKMVLEIIMEARK